jgi:hypothetical protein
VPRKIADRMIQQAELLRFVPASGSHVVAICDQVPSQRQHQHQRVFRQRADCVSASVTDGDVVTAAIIEVDVVSAGCGNGYEFQFWQLRKNVSAQRQFVADRDRRITQTIDDLTAVSFAIFDPLVREVWTAKRNVKGVAFEEDDRFDFRVVLHNILDGSDRRRFTIMDQSEDLNRKSRKFTFIRIVCLRLNCDVTYT